MLITQLLSCFLLGTQPIATELPAAPLPIEISALATDPETDPTFSPVYAGTWAVEVQRTPIGTVRGDIKLSADTLQQGYNGSITIYGGTFDLLDLQVAEEEIRAHFILDPIGIRVNIFLSGNANGPLKGKFHGRYFTVAERTTEE